MRKLLMLLLTLALVLVPFAAAQANGEPVLISLNAAETVTVSPGDHLVLKHGWGACTRGLVQSYLTAAHTEISLDGVLISTADGKDPYWSAITAEPDVPWLESCVVGSQRVGWTVYWEYPLGTLSPGAHTVGFYYWLDHPVLDGSDYDGDGTPDAFNGLLQERTITIIVE